MHKLFLSSLLLCGLVFASCGKGSTTSNVTTPTEPVTKPEPAVHHSEDDSDEKKKVTAAFETIYKAVQANDKAHYGTFFVYRGEDKDRAWKDVLNLENSKEKLEADKMWAELTVMLQGVVSYKVKKYFTESESEGTWHLLVLDLKRESADEEATFAFLSVKGTYAIGDID